MTNKFRKYEKLGSAPIPEFKRDLRCPFCGEVVVAQADYPSEPIEVYNCPDEKLKPMLEAYGRRLERELLEQALWKAVKQHECKKE